MAPVRPEHRSESLPARVALTLLRTGSTLLSKETWAAREEGLPTLQANLLVRILHSETRDATVGALAEAFGLTPPTISDSLKALVRKGLLERTHSQEDGRVVFFHCTPRGRTVGKKLSRWAEAVEGSVSALSLQEQTTFMELLTRVLRDRVLEGLPVPENMCVSCGHFQTMGNGGGVRFHCRQLNAVLSPEALKTDCLSHEAVRPAAS